MSHVKSLQKQLVAAKPKEVALYVGDQCCRSRVFNKHGRRRIVQRCNGFEHYRRSRILAKARQGEARTLAEQMMDTHTESLMLGIAASYEKIAKWNVVASRVKREIMDLNETIIEIADHRRHLQVIKDAVLDAQDLCARARSTVQASQELLQEVDDLYRSNVGPVLHKNKCGV